MSSFKLICEDEAVPFGGSFTLQQEFQSEDLYNILGNITKFLQRCGYLDNTKELTMQSNINLDENLDAFTENLFNGVHADHTVITGGAGVDVITLGNMKYEFDKNVQI